MISKGHDVSPGGGGAAGISEGVTNQPEKNPEIVRTALAGMDAAVNDFKSSIGLDSKKARSSASSVERFFFRDEERRKWEEVLVYLSFHPAIKNISDRMGLWQLDQIDYYSIVQNTWSKTFKKTNALGIPGTKARIMMLFLWSLASGRSKEQVVKLVSSEVGRGMSAGPDKGLSDEMILVQLGGRYKGVIEDLAKEVQSDLSPEIMAILNQSVPSDLESRGEDYYQCDSSGGLLFDAGKLNNIISLLADREDKKTIPLKPIDNRSERILLWFVDAFLLGCRTGTGNESDYYFVVDMPGMSTLGIVNK